MIDTENVLKRDLETMRNCLEEFSKLEQALSSITDHRVTLDAWKESIRIEGHFTELTDLRSHLRFCLGSWKDELGSIWNPYGEEIIISYKNKAQPLIHLWVRGDKKDFPKELITESCSLERNTATDDQWIYVCKKAE